MKEQFMVIMDEELLGIIKELCRDCIETTYGSCVYCSAGELEEHQSYCLSARAQRWLKRQGA